MKRSMYCIPQSNLATRVPLVLSDDRHVFIQGFLRNCSRFELLTACLWRCPTITISPEPDQEVRLVFAVSPRRKFNPPIPKGYYGNTTVCNPAVATAGDLSKNLLHYAAELVRKAKDEVTEEYIRSVADLLVMRGRPSYTLARSFAVPDLTHVGFERMDFGWGKVSKVVPQRVIIKD